MRSALLVCALALLAVCAVPLATADADLEWVQPAFVETLSESTPFPGEVTIDPSLLAVDAQVDLSAMTDAQAEAYHTALLAQTVTAEGKSQAELQAEIEARAPSLWSSFKAAFSKRYADETGKYRTFVANLARIALLNARAALSSLPSRLKVVHSHLVEHADLSADEFRRMLGSTPTTPPAGIRVAPPPPRRALRRPGQSFVEMSAQAEQDDVALLEADADADVDADVDAELDAELDALADLESELDAGVDAEADAEVEAEVEAEAEVDAENADANAPLDCDFRAQSTAIRNQGSCGSCWAHSAAATLESAYALKTGKKSHVLSPQQLLDCVPLRNGACGGGQPHTGLSWWAAHQGGAAPESKYRYKGRGGRCVNTTDIKKWNGPNPKPINVEFAIPLCAAANCNPDENLLGHSLSSSGPLSVNIDASQMQFYRSGVIGPSSGCSSAGNRVNHAVNLEGLGTDRSSGKRYWIVRNSWGTRWGESGRFRLEFGKNTCGIGTWVVKVTV